MTATREQVIAYRIAAQGLHRTADEVAELDVLDLGVQEAMGHAASVIFAARVTSAERARDVEVGPGHDFALAWTYRGAPHVHRRTDLDQVGRALWPLSEADAMTKLNENNRSVEQAGIAALDQFETAVRELRSVITRPTVKGTASTEVTRRLPVAMRRECRPCGTSHLSDSAMRAAAPGAGLELEPGTSPPVLLRRSGARLPKRADPAAAARAALAYLRFLGPATDAEAAAFLGARRADLRGAMSDLADELVAVEVEGARCSLPADRLDQFDSAPPPEFVRLLGPFDPYLQARDRDLIVPDRALHKVLWPALGRPGAVLAHGEIVGSWRAKASGSRLTITVTTSRRAGRELRAAVTAEAERIGVLRRAGRLEVAWA